MDYRPGTPGTTTSHLGYHDVTLGVPSEWTLLNVHTIKNKSRIFYFDLILIVNIMNNYFTYFCKSKMSFYDTKTLTMVFYYLGGNRFFSLRSFMWLVHKLVHITTPIGHGELDLVQQFTLGGPRSLVINGFGYFPKKEPTLLLTWFHSFNLILFTKTQLTNFMDQNLDHNYANKAGETIDVIYKHRLV